MKLAITVLMVAVSILLTACGSRMDPKPASREVSVWAKKCLTSNCAGDIVIFDKRPAQFVAGGRLPGHYHTMTLRSDIDYLNETDRLGEIVGFVSIDSDPAIYTAVMRKYVRRNNLIQIK